MRVLEVCARFYPAVGGGETYAWSTAKSLVSRGHQVTVWTSDLYSCLPWVRLPRHRETIDGIDVVRTTGLSPPIDRLRTYLFIPGQSLAWVGDATGFDVVNLLGYGSYSAYGQLPQWYARKFPVVLSTITMPDQGLLRRVYDRFVGRRLLNASRHLICLTSAEKRYFMQLGCPESKISLIPPGPAIDLQQVASTVRAPSHQDLEPPAKYILSFGRLAPNKGLPTLLAASAPLLAQDPELKLVFAGENHGVLPDLTRRARALNIQGQVVFTGRVTDAEAVRLIEGCSVFAFPSEWGEAFGMTLLTAMQLGKPVVATELPGAIDLVQPEETGLRVPCGDVAEMRSALNRLLSHPELASKLGEEARRRTKEITWETVGKRMSEILEDAAAQ